MTLLLWLLVIAAALYALHRVALLAEGRGWIYYRKKQGSSGGLGTAFLEVQSLLEPGKRHVLEAQQQDDAEEEDSADPPETGSKPRGSHWP